MYGFHNYVLMRHAVYIQDPGNNLPSWCLVQIRLNYMNVCVFLPHRNASAWADIEPATSTSEARHHTQKIRTCADGCTRCQDAGVDPDSVYIAE